jgi:putative hemolysin
MMEMKYSAYLTIALMAISIAGCMTTVKVHYPDINQTNVSNGINVTNATADMPILTYQTYGGLVNPAYARRILTVTPDSMNLTIYSIDGSTTESYQQEIDISRYNIVLNLYVKNGFASFEENYTPDAHVADIGNAMLSYYQSGVEKKVSIMPYMTDGLPQGLVNILDSMRTLSDTMSRPTSVTLYYQPMQCQYTPWELWLSNSSIRFIKQPTQEDIAKMYYSQALNITLLSFDQQAITDATCDVCNVCPQSIKYIAKVDVKDVNTMISDGWNSTDGSSQGTQLANPASQYCESHGYNLIINTSVDGSQTGYCVFANGMQCEEWSYYTGECGP